MPLALVLGHSKELKLAQVAAQRRQFDVRLIPELVRDPHFASRGVFMEAFHPEHGGFRQVGPVLAGTADENSAVNLHLFTDSPEMVAMEIGDMGIAFRPYERRLKSRRGQVEMYPGFEFSHRNETIQATIFPVDGIRQAPISPIDGKPMRRVDSEAVQVLLSHV